MRRRRVLVLAAAILGLTTGGLYLGAAAVTYDQVSRLEPDCGGRFTGYTPATWTAAGASGDWSSDLDVTPWRVPTWQEVRFPSRDAGIELRAWWMPATGDGPAPLVVVVPGRGACVRDPAVLLPAGMLWHAGFDVLAVDLRDHGASTWEDGRYAGGTEEYRDVEAAIDWAIAAGSGRAGIGVTGVSMGAVTALIAAGEDPRVAAVWEDSGYADVVTRIADELSQRGFPPILAAAGPLMGRLLGGDDFDSHTPLAAIRALGDRPLGVVHGGSDRRTYVSHAADLVAEAWRVGVPTDVWVIPDAGHGEAMFLLPDRYAARMVTFFRDAFSGS